VLFRSAVKRASAAVVGVTAAGAALALARTLEVSLPGPAAALILELPPVRWPRLGNVAQKSRARLRGFFTTVLPALVGCNLAVRLFLQSRYLTALSGLDPLAAAAFGLTGPALAGLLVTVFQRYLAPLVLLSLELTPRQATIAASMVCVSFPCLPVVVLCWRELGGRRCGQLLALATLLPVVTGGCLHRVLP
jgi:ferrous iron transport protein B